MRVLDSSVPEEGELFKKMRVCSLVWMLQKMKTVKKVLVAQDVASGLFFELSMDCMPCPALHWLGI